MISNKTRNAILDKFGKPNPSILESQNVIDTSISPIESDIGNDLQISIDSINTIDRNVINNTNNNNIIYKGLEILDTDEPSLQVGNNIIIVLYNKLSNNKNSLLLFGLQKKDDNLSFPIIKYDKKEKPSKFILNKLSLALKNYYEPKFYYNGFLKQNNKTYMFVECDFTLKYQAFKASADDQWWFALVSEIVNNQSMLYHFPIDKSVTQLFLENTKLCYLVDNTGKILETPNVGYYGDYYKRITYAAALGQRKEDAYAGLGPYYYFNSYPRAARYAIWTEDFKPMKIGDTFITDNRGNTTNWKDNGRYTKGGIVRFAIFTGKHNMFLNRASDPDDRSEMTKYLIEKDPYWKGSKKVRDPDGKWTKKYDSVGLGNKKYVSKSFDLRWYPRGRSGERTRSSKLLSAQKQGLQKFLGQEKEKPNQEKEKPNQDKVKTLYSQQVLKDYEQQICLTYYYVNTDQDAEDLTNIKIE